LIFILGEDPAFHGHPAGVLLKREEEILSEKVLANT
jgi:hypothetical protein